MEWCVKGRGRPDQRHDIRQWAEQGGEGRHRDAVAEAQVSEVDVVGVQIPCMCMTENISFLLGDFLTADVGLEKAS